MADNARSAILDTDTISPVTGEFVPGEDDVPVGSTVGPYRLRQKLGEGGMGVVWLAEQSEPVHRQVALKIIKPGMNSGAIVARFAAERQALALMDHPNIAKFYDAGMVEHRLYFVMELVKGISITKYCDQQRLSPRERLALFIPVCRAVQHAHQKGVIHRDLKPSNVIIGLYDGRAIPKVIDFGVSKVTAQQINERTIFTEIGQLVGTLEYMAPEQTDLNNLDIDTRADIYSLGVILYELLAGSPPFTPQQLRGAAFTEMLRMIREVEPPKPSTKLSSSEHLPNIAANRHSEPRRLTNLIHGDLDWIVMKCLEKDRTRRYETSNGLALDLERYLNDEPVLAGPPARWYRLRKFVQRNRGPVVAASLLALSLIGGVIGTAVGMWRARTAEHAAVIALAETEQQRDRATEISRFLENDLLELADSRRQAGASMLADPDLKVKTLVQRAAQRIDGRFADRPVVEAALRTTIGKALFAVGEAGLAIPLFQRARQINTQLHGATAMETIYATSFLTRAQMEDGKLDDALPLCRFVHDHCLTTLGERHADTLAAKNDLAYLLQMRGDLKQALPFFERVLELRKETLGPDHDDTLLSMNNLGYCYFGLAQHDKSLAIHQETHQRRLAKHGEDHPDTLSSLNNVATAQLELGAILEALPLLEKSYELHCKRMGLDHPDTWQSMDNLSWTLRALGRTERAIALGEEALKLRLAKLGPNHPDTFQSQNNLGSVYYNLGQFERSLELHLQALHGRQAKLGEKHQHTVISMNNVATTYMALGQAIRAVPLLERAHEIDRAEFGSDNPSTLHCLNSLAGAYLEVGQVERAITLLEQTLATRRVKLPPDHPETLRSMHNLAQAHQSANQLDKSLPLFADVLQRRRQKLGADHQDTLLSTIGLASNQLAQRKFAEAEAVVRECLPVAEKKHPNAWFTFQLRCQLGAALVGQQIFADAERLLVDGYAGLNERIGTMPVAMRRIRRTAAVESLIQLNEGLGKPAEAAKWKLELDQHRAAPVANKP